MQHLPYQMKEEFCGHQYLCEASASPVVKVVLLEFDLLQTEDQQLLLGENGNRGSVIILSGKLRLTRSFVLILK